MARVPDKLVGVRKLEIRYTNARPGSARLSVERLDGAVSVCDVDDRLIGDFLEGVCLRDARMSSRIRGRR